MNNTKRYYSSWINDSDILKDSSSGGIFSALAIWVLQKDGYVFGVSRVEDLSLKHIEICSFEDLAQIRKSKYYQSDMRNVYHLVEKRLQDNVPILFSGTACQVNALKKYLQCKRIDTNNLLTVDVLCHGVSNLSVYKKYLESQEKKFHRKINYTDFRTKKVPWLCGGGTSMTLYFDDSAQKILSNSEDTYYLAFGSNLILRPSCYSCPFAGDDKGSDFTIADFWGIKIDEESKDELEHGVGLTVVNTKKAHNIWKELVDKDIVTSKEVKREYAIKNNLAFVEPQKEHPKRTYFFTRYKVMDYNSLIRKIMFRQWLIANLKIAIGRENINKIKKIVKK